MSPSEIRETLEKYAQFLIEHCNTVVILASVYDPNEGSNGTSFLYHNTKGDVHAVIGVLEHHLRDLFKEVTDEKIPD